MMSAPSSTGSGLAGGPQSSILSEKVHRALQVRTDTPAMKAALEALAHLPHHHHQQQGGYGSNNNTSDDSKVADDDDEDAVVVDSRSVRVAIEQDALNQALLLQNELKALVDTVAALRQGVTDTAAIADRLRSVIHTDVTVSVRNTVPTTTVDSTDDDDSMAEDVDDDEAAVADDLAAAMAEASSANKSVLEEAQLARTLRDAFGARDQARKRLQVVQAFLEKFDLSEQDSRLLDHYNFEDMQPSAQQLEEGPANPVNGMAFLQALQRVVHIRQALTKTFGPEAAGTTGSNADHESNQLGTSSALRMMESLAQKQEQAYERLYHWLQQYLNLSGTASTAAPSALESAQYDDRMDEVLSHPFCKKALQTLHHVPAFYAHTLELIANARRSQATKQFLLALTSGHAGLPPIEMKAHDSVAYVGDMLAFCFRSFSVEADFAKGLRLLVLEQQQHDAADGDDNDNDGGATISTMPSEDAMMGGTHQPMSAQETLALTMSGVARPLKSRILQVISTLARSSRRGDGAEGADAADDMGAGDSMDEDEYLDEEGSVQRHKVTQLYEICGLLLFYASAMENTVKHKLKQVDERGNKLVDLEEDRANSTTEPSPLMKAVFECLEEATNAYEATIRVYAAMLVHLSSLTGDSEAVLAYHIMDKVAKVRVASPGFSSDVPCPKQFQLILSLDFALEVALEAALSTCKSLDDAITLQSTITLTQEAGLSDPTVVDRLTKMVHDKESSLIEGLVTAETTQVLDLCGLGSVGTAWKRFQEAAAKGGAHNATMAAYPGLSPEEMQEAMKEFYTSLYSPPLPSLEKIKEPVARKAARRQIAQRVCLLYGELYQAIMDEHQRHGGEPGSYADVSFLGHTPEQVVTLFTA